MNDKERIKAVLKYLDISQKKLAESIGYTADNINKIYNGHQPISRFVAEKISNKYPINFNWLLSGEPPMTTEGQINISTQIDELKSRCQRYEQTIDTLNKSIGMLEHKKKDQLDTQAIIKELEEKCEEILTGSVNRNFEQLMEELEGKILNILKNNE